MKFIKSDEKQWSDKNGYSKKVILNSADLDFPGALVQQIKIKPGETAASHYHKKQTEVFYFLNSNGYFVVNGEKIALEAGDTLVIEPNDKHTVINETKQDFLYMAFKINYDEDDLFWD